MSGGKEEFDPHDFFQYMLKNKLLFNRGHIMFANILEREENSNMGNALDGMIYLSYPGLATGLNIGRNPIGTGYQSYIPFLDEINCKTEAGLYVLGDLKGKEIYIVSCENTTRGFLTPKGFDSVYRDVQKSRVH